MTQKLGILDLLTTFGFDANCKAKLVRHQDQRYDIPTLIRDGWMDMYQCLQAKNIFGKCDYIVSSIGDGGTRARFHGVYRILETHPLRPELIPDECPFQT